jgi:hypothetical protein
MKRALYIASGISVVITTLAYGYMMQRQISHLVTMHGENFGHPFFAAHANLIAAAGVLSLIGAYFLLTGWRRQDSN